MPLQASDSNTTHVLIPQLCMEPCLLSLGANSGEGTPLHRPGLFYLAICSLTCMAILAPGMSSDAALLSESPALDHQSWKPFWTMSKSVDQ